MPTWANMVIKIGCNLTKFLESVGDYMSVSCMA